MESASEKSIVELFAHVCPTRFLHLTTISYSYISYIYIYHISCPFKENASNNEQHTKPAILDLRIPPNQSLDTVLAFMAK